MPRKTFNPKEMQEKITTAMRLIWQVESSLKFIAGTCETGDEIGEEELIGFVNIIESLQEKALDAYNTLNQAELLLPPIPDQEEKEEAAS